MTATIRIEPRMSRVPLNRSLVIDATPFISGSPSFAPAPARGNGPAALPHPFPHSEPETVRKPRREKADRRVARTRHALAMALMQLTVEKRYDAITIQDLLDRAGVGRSTFYEHYRGKDDLLTRSFEGMIEMSMGMLDAR